MSDYNNFKGNHQSLSSVDLSGVTWSQNSGFSESSNVGTAFASMINNGASGKRVISDLIDVPDTGLIIDINDGYQFSLIAYDSSGNYLKKYITWASAPTVVHDSSVKKIALVVRNYNETTTLSTSDVILSGISIKYSAS